MKPQIALNPNQMHELQSLGLDCSDASMVWELKGETEPRLRVNTLFDDIRKDYEKFGYIPAYTLEDILRKVVMKIDFVPRADKPMKWQSCRFSKYFYADTPLDAAFTMLKYAIKNYPDKIKRL